MERNEIEQLAQFNSERARGLVHTTEYVAKMRRLQDRFDEKAETRGLIAPPPDDFVEAIPCGDGITRYFPKLRGR